MSSRTKLIKVDYLARVEGEGALHLKVRDDKVIDAKLRIFEPPRFFEAFLRGRKFTEAPDITARICGICPIAHQTSSATAMEHACGVEVGGQLRELRRLIYLGEYIESHALHIFMLHAPDFLGYEDAIQMAGDYPDMKKLGNAIMTLIGGREIHPVNLKVGGFYSVPSKKELEGFVEELKWARDASLETVRWTSKLDFPDFHEDYEFVALRLPDEYAVIDGDLATGSGREFPVSKYEDHFVEEQASHSTSLRSQTADNKLYHVGPLARYSINFDKLSPIAQQAALEAGLASKCFNSYQSIIVRAVETLHACEESLRIIENYEPPEKPAVEVTPRAGTGYGCTEAPRGIDYHRYSIDDRGLITSAKIVAPTSQNQKIIESDLFKFASENIDLPNEQLRLRCEQLIRNYDPCISCSCHALELHINRE